MELVMVEQIKGKSFDELGDLMGGFSWEHTGDNQDGGEDTGSNDVSSSTECSDGGVQPQGAMGRGRSIMAWFAAQGDGAREGSPRHAQEHEPPRRVALRVGQVHRARGHAPADAAADGGKDHPDTLASVEQPRIIASRAEQVRRG